MTSQLSSPSNLLYMLHFYIFCLETKRSSRAGSSARICHHTKRLFSSASTLSDGQWSAVIWMCWALCKRRRRAAEVERGGASLGGQQTKRARNLRFLSRVEPSDTHYACCFVSMGLYWLCTYVGPCEPTCPVFVVFSVCACWWVREAASILYIRKQSKSLFI